MQLNPLFPEARQLDTPPVEVPPHWPPLHLSGWDAGGRSGEVASHMPWASEPASSGLAHALYALEV